MANETIETIIVSIIFIGVILFLMSICHLLSLAYCGKSCFYCCRDPRTISTTSVSEGIPDVLYVVRGQSNNTGSNDETKSSPEIVFL